MLQIEKRGKDWRDPVFFLTLSACTTCGDFFSFHIEDVNKFFKYEGRKNYE